MREWERVSPGQGRAPESAVEDFLDRLEADGLTMHGFAMLDGGRLLAEGYWAPFDRNSLHRMYSVGKSFTALAIGLLQQEGKLGLDDGICEHFRDKCPKEGVHPWIRETTVRHMLTMTTCHRSPAYRQYEGDWVEAFFRVEPTNLPGAVFSYDTGATHVLAALAERLSGKPLMDYLREKVFDRIGVSGEAYYMRDPYGISMGGSGLNCTLRDVLAVAELVTEGGSFEGEQLLPPEFLREAVSCRIPTLQQTARDERLGYGYQIWQGRHGSFFFYGIGGQLAVCLPKERFVLVTMADTLDNKNGIKDIFDAFDESIYYPWLCPSRERREETSLTHRLAGLALKKVPGEETSPARAQVSGRRYLFPGNTLQISELTLSLSREKSAPHTLRMVKEGREFDLSFDTAEYHRCRFPWPTEGTGQTPECLCHGAWILEDFLLIRCHILGTDMASLTIGLRFQKGRVTVRLQKGADNAMQSFEGVASSLG